MTLHCRQGVLFLQGTLHLSLRSFCVFRIICLSRSITLLLCPCLSFSSCSLSLRPLCLLVSLNFVSISRVLSPVHFLLLISRLLSPPLSLLVFHSLSSCVISCILFYYWMYVRVFIHVITLLYHFLSFYYLVVAFPLSLS